MKREYPHALDMLKQLCASYTETTPDKLAAIDAAYAIGGIQAACEVVWPPGTQLLPTGGS